MVKELLACLEEWKAYKLELHVRVTQQQAFDTKVRNDTK